MYLVGSRGFLGLRSGRREPPDAAGLGVLGAGQLAWSAVFGAAGLGFVHASFRERDAYFRPAAPILGEQLLILRAYGPGRRPRPDA
jgi:hypothetical protein